MSFSKTTLSAIHQAGQALHQATVVVASAVREQAEHMVSTVASQPFEAEGEQAFANFKMLARLSHDLQTLEGQLRSLYATASELASPEMDVVSALPHADKPSSASVGKDVAEDAIVKPASTRSARAARSRERIAKPAPQAKGTAAQPKGRKKGDTASLTPNDRMLLQLLQSALNRNTWTPLTGNAMAQGSGLPLGSVGVSLKKVLASGAVIRGDRGQYKLGA